MRGIAPPNSLPTAPRDIRELIGHIDVSPIVAAVDGTEASRVAVDEAVRLGKDLDAPVVFVHVRRGPPGFLGEPVYQRRLTKKMANGRRTLSAPLPLPLAPESLRRERSLEGSPRRRITEFAADRGARLVVAGSRKRKLKRSVSSGIVRSAEQPVVVARGRGQLAVAA